MLKAEALTVVRMEEFSYLGTWKDGTLSNGVKISSFDKVEKKDIIDFICKVGASNTMTLTVTQEMVALRSLNIDESLHYSHACAIYVEAKDSALANIITYEFKKVMAGN